MRLSFKITLTLFLITTLFIAVLSVYFLRQMNRTFREQADRLLKQSVALTQQRLDVLKDQLQSEMTSLVSSVFTENENTIVAMLSEPPQYNAEVVQFAEKLRRRTTLDFLYITSSSGTILSNSVAPAAFGKTDPQMKLLPDEIAYLRDPNGTVELKRQLKFGNHVLFLRGGYDLQNRLKPLSGSELQLQYQEGAEDIPSPVDSMVLQQILALKDPDGRTIASLIVSTSQGKLVEERSQLITKSIFLLLASLLGCLLIGWLISTSISKPLRTLTSAAQEMTEGNFDVRVQESSDGEIGKLIHAFNSMTDQLDENRRKLIQTERIAAWQDIARHLAHEIKNPLTPIRTSITNLRLAMERAPEKFPEIFRESSKSILEEVETLRHLADEFAGFARLPAPNPQLHSINEVVQRTVALYKESAPANVQIDWQPGNVRPSRFDANQIGQVVQNLLKNSIEALTDDGTIVLRSQETESMGKWWIDLIIQDSGPGMTADIQEQIFSPYFTTKTKGTGLGLAIVYRIVTEHGGNILVESEPGKGTRFKIRLPLS
jgi:nitrogen fixation/metabolism regulation signal transduction histidine kinase